VICLHLGWRIAKQLYGRGINNFVEVSALRMLKPGQKVWPGFFCCDDFELNNLAGLKDE
jgi:hypothetical protein